MAVGAVEIEMAKARPFRPPDEVAVFQGVEILIQVDPGRLMLAQNDPTRAGGGIDLQQVQMRLVPAFALDI
jgi:hypothetical protein